ncbi:MAG TPA: carbohydrate porin, partial [Rhodanobacteraceae bacterium]|nr:carbohydrate porin [Rhodanobacteraceae bacterium]
MNRCITIIAALFAAFPCAGHADDAPRPFVPQLLSAQYTFIDQHQDALRSPYSGPLSLKANGDTERSHTFGVYFGVQLPAHFQYYFDVEMFKGEGVSGAIGVGAIVNGDVVHSGNAGLGKRAYVARRYLRWTLPLGGAPHAIDRGQDQLPGVEAARYVEAKLGRMTPADDFDKNRYANGARTQFMDGAFFNALAWDYAADTRGYTNGLMLAYVSPHWTLRYGVYQMPTRANGQTLQWPLKRARGEQMQLTLRESPESWALRLLVYRNIARMGIYRDALRIAESTGTTPDIRADDRDGRHKYGYAL